MDAGREETALRARLAPAELAAWRGFLRVHAALVKALDAELEKRTGLPLSSYEVLITLEAAPGQRLRMAELADRVLLSRSGMTRLVDRLERDGLLSRSSCSSDGRGMFAVLTDDGRRLVARTRPEHLAGVRERFLRHFDAEELATMAAWWERLVPGASATDSAAAPASERPNALVSGPSGSAPGVVVDGSMDGRNLSRSD